MGAWKGTGYKKNHHRRRPPSSAAVVLPTVASNYAMNYINSQIIIKLCV